jgi:hypothetical protein
MILRSNQIHLKENQISFPSSMHEPQNHSGQRSYGLKPDLFENHSGKKSYGLPNKVLSGR